jgi:hypothetical protein
MFCPIVFVVMVDWAVVFVVIGETIHTKPLREKENRKKTFEAEKGDQKSPSQCAPITL